MSLFPGFRDHRATRQSSNAGPVEIFARVGGALPKMELIRIWRHVAPSLAEHFTVVAADMRGYGRSSKPKGTASHEEYSKREMANDVIHLMNDLGFDKFNVLAHDRGAHVAHRIATDHPGMVDRMILMDILPLLYVFENCTKEIANNYFHWFFMIQASPETENFILADPQKYWDLYKVRLGDANGQWTEADLKEYQDSYFTWDGIHGGCEDYRAAATIDLDHERKSRDSNQHISVDRFKLIYARKGPTPLEKGEDVWRQVCALGVEVSSQAIESGHYIAEEKPDELLEVALKFFRD